MMGPSIHPTLNTWRRALPHTISREIRLQTLNHTPKLDILFLFDYILRRPIAFATSITLKIILFLSCVRLQQFITLTKLHLLKLVTNYKMSCILLNKPLLFV